MSTSFGRKKFSAVGLWATAVVVFAVLGGCRQAERKRASALPSTTETLVAEGKALYYRRDCVKCHGFRGDGKAVSGLLLKGTPRDFADLEGYKQGSSAEAIAHTLKVGILGEKKTAMPAYPYLSERERLALAHYILELRKKRLEEPEPKP